MGVTTAAENQACRVAFVGGGITVAEHVRAFRDVPGVEIVGIANRTVGKAEAIARKFNIPRVFGSVDEMCLATNPDLVQVTVYESAIKHVVLSCLKYDCAVFMEKPIGRDLLEAVEIERAAVARGRRVWVGLNRRQYSSTQAVLEDLADDPSPRFVHVQDQQSQSQARALGFDEAIIERWMFANSIHLVDYFGTFGRGAITKVTSVVPWTPQKPGIVIARIDFASGDIGLYEAVWNGPGPWACVVTTGRRRWEMRPLEAAQFQDAGERKLNPIELHVWDGQFKPGFRRQAEQVVAAWRGEGSAQPTLAEGVRIMRLIHDIYGL